MKTSSDARRALYLLAVSSICVALIAVCSFLSIPVGELKITLQLAAVLFTAGVLPPLWATGAVLAYILLGLVGVPVFASFSSGVGALAGPTGGFIIGFLPSALAASVSAHFIAKKKTAPKAVVFLLYVAAFTAATLTVYLCGTVGFVRYMPEKGLSYALTAAVLPYIGFDIAKILFFAFLCVRIGPRVREAARR